MTTKTLSLIAASLLLSNTLYAEETLKDITVTTANKTAQSLQNVTSNVEVITADDIEERGYTTVVEALNSLPGISFSSNGGVGQPASVYLRGMDSKRTLVLIDGIRYNDPTGLNGAPFSDLLVDDIERIEVVKGAQSGIWGADASAGVINIITKSGTKGTHGSIKAEHGSFNTTHTNVELSHHTESYYLAASGSKISSDGFSAVQPYGTDLDNLEDDGYENKTYAFKAGIHLNETNKIDLSHRVIDSKTEADAYSFILGGFDPNSQYDVDAKYTFSSLKFNHVDSFNELNLYANRSTFSRYYPQSGFSPRFDGETREYGITSKITYRTTDFLLIGADYKTFKHKNSINKKTKNKGLFLSNTNIFEGFMGGKTILNESLRYDKYDTFKNKVTGKIGLKHIHENIQGLTTSLNYGTAYNIPTLYQLYTPFFGNSTLKPETTKSWDLTIAYKDFSLTYFHTRIEDLIDYDTSIFKYGNLAGTSKINGIEIAYRKEILENLLLTTNYTHLIAAKDSNNKTLGRRPKDDLKFGIDYYGIEKLHIGVDGEYVGKRYDRTDNQGRQTGKYTIINMTADYQLNKNVKLYGKIVNATDKSYQTVDGYASSPRAFTLGLKASF